MLDFREDSFEATLYKYVSEQLNDHKIAESFPWAVMQLTEKPMQPVNCCERVDLTELKAFTIDNDTTEDIDDAVSLEEDEEGFSLGIHIADASAYAAPGSLLFKEAMHRTFTLYLPQNKIPMLPPILTDELCSLRPGEFRFTISLLIRLDKSGAVTDFKLVKGQICSRLKGKFSEINAILNGTADKLTIDKYSECIDSIRSMDKLAGLLRQRRIAEGSEVYFEEEPDIVFEKGDVVLIPRVEGPSDRIIAEFMVLANRSVAAFFINNNLPGIYRNQREGQPAVYSTTPLLNETVASSYVHYTSPLRRLPDLCTHQVLTAFLGGCPAESLRYLFDSELCEACESSENRGKEVITVERNCKRYCYKRWFSVHGREGFTGVVKSRDSKGRYLIQLDAYNVRTLSADSLKLIVGDRVSLTVNPKGTILNAENVRVI